MLGLTMTNKKIVGLTVLVIIIFSEAMLIGAVPPPAAEFYGTIVRKDGSNVSVGTNISAYDSDGVLCGTFIVTNEGFYGLLSCNGDDPDTPEDEGAESYDIISFRINGTLAIATGNNSWISGDFHEVNFTANSPPVLDPIHSLTAYVGELFEYDVNATDPDNDVLYFSTNSSFLFVIDNLTGMISFTPTLEQRGNYTVNVSVTDGYLTDYEVIIFRILRGPYCGDGICNGCLLYTSPSPRD